MTYLEKVAYLTGRGTLIRTFSFDADFLSRGLGADYGYFINTGQTGAIDPVLDTLVKASGQNSIKFTIGPNSSAGAAGQLFFNFSAARNVSFGAGDTIYYQFQMAWDRFMLEHQFQTIGGAPSGFKHSMFGHGDPASSSCVYGGDVTGCAGSHSPLEIVWNEKSGQHKFPTIYNDVNGTSSPWELPNGGDPILQDAIPACLYSTLGAGAPGCHHYSVGFANPSDQRTRFGTWTQQITFGALVGDVYQNCVGNAWVSWAGSPAVKLFDNHVFQQPASGGLRYAKGWILPYMTNKDSAENHQTTWVWAANPIVSIELPPLTTDEVPQGNLALVLK